MPPGRGLKRRSRWTSPGFLIIALVTASALGFGGFALLNPSPVGPVGSTHHHAALKIYVEGRPIDLSTPAYQVKSGQVHLEGGDGDIVHVHATGVRMSFFLNTLGMKLSRDCLTIGSTQYCNAGGKTVKFFANGVANKEWADYLILQGDRILISYGAETGAALEQQLASIRTQIPPSESS